MVLSWAYNAGTNTATLSGAGSTTTFFADLVAADTAGGWGVYTADATGTQIICAGKIVVGDGTNAAVCSDTNKQVIAIGFTAGDQTWLSLSNKSSITFGELTDATDKTSRYGCVIYVYYNNAYAGIRITGHSGATFNLYSCMIIGKPNRVDISYLYGNVYNCQFNRCDISYFSGDWYNSIGSTNSFYLGFIRDIVAGSTLDRIEVYDDSAAAIACGYNALTITNAKIRNCTYAFYKYTHTSDDVGNLYAVNCDVDTWHISWGGANAYGWIYRQYEFDLQTLPSVTVTITDAAGTVVYTGTSDAVTGTIPTQTLTRSYYDQAHGDNEQLVGPHTLTISGAGYIPYSRTWLIEEKTKWLIELHDQLAGNATESDVTFGKWFYSDNADILRVGTYTPTQLMEQRTKIRRVENPVDELLLMYTGMLTIENQKLRRNRIEPKPS